MITKNMEREQRIRKIINNLDKDNKVLKATNDCVFKALFQSEECKPVLAYVIGEVLNLTKEYVLNNMSFKPTELAKERYFEHGKITDLIIEITGKVINLEMNQESKDKQGKVIKNNKYHHTLAGRTLLIAEDYKNMKEIVQINFDLINRFDDRIIIPFRLMDEEGKFILDEKFTNYHINMEKVREKGYNIDELNKFEKILLILQEESKTRLKELSKGDGELIMMVKKIEEMSYNPELIGLYDKEKRDAVVNGINIADAEKKGSKEKQIEIAKNMLLKGTDIEFISEVTNLSKDEIENLK